jgi:membrane protease YdiL (CAAX protease family)
MCQSQAAAGWREHASGLQFLLSSSIGLVHAYVWHASKRLLAAGGAHAVWLSGGDCCLQLQVRQVLLAQQQTQLALLPWVHTSGTRA